MPATLKGGLALGELSQKSERPPRSTVTVERLPPDLRSGRQFCLWRYELRPPKWTKVPLQPDGHPAKSDDPSTWSELADCLAAFGKGHSDGVGRFFDRANRIVGVDLDSVADGGKLTPEAAEIVRRLDSYSEWSPSGRGVHVFVRGTIPGPRRRKGNIELYSELRYFALTGDPLDGAPATVEARQDALDELYRTTFGESAPPKPAPASPLQDDSEILQRARTAANGVKFGRLYDTGDLAAYGGDDSAGDFALATLLSFWTGPDPARIERIMRGSALARSKWNQKRPGGTYLSQTIGKALNGATEFYKSGQAHHRDGARPEDPAVGFGSINNFLKLPSHLEIVAVEKLGVDRDSEFDLLLRDGRRVGVGTTDDILRWPRFRAALAAGCQVVVLHTVRPAFWLPWAANLISGARLVDIGRRDDDSSDWVRGFIRHSPEREVNWDDQAERFKELKQLALSNWPLVTTGGEVFLKIGDLLRHVTLVYGQRTTAGDLRTRLARIGFVASVVSARDPASKAIASVRLWKSPATFTLGGD